MADHAAPLYQTASEVTRLMGSYTAGEISSGDGLPSEHAHRLACQLILYLRDAGFTCDASDVYTDADDALRLQWRAGDRQVKVVFPFSPHEKPYMYYSGGEEFEAQSDPAPGQILDRLRWVFAFDESRQRVA